MAKTFAKLNDSNIVTQVTIVDDGNAASEAKGEAFLRTIYFTNPNPFHHIL